MIKPEQIPKIPFLEQLKTVVLEKTTSVTRGPSIIRHWSDIDSSTPLSSNKMLRMKTEATVSQEFLVPENASKAELEVHERRAVRAICHAVYGTIEAELHMLQRELWEIGVPLPSAPMERLEALILATQGSQEKTP